MTPDLGVVAAAVAPRGPKGDLDCGATFELVDFLCAARVTGIALFTAAAEYPAFGVEERMRVLYLAAKRSRVPVYAGVGAIGLAHPGPGRPAGGSRGRAGTTAAFLPLPAG